MAKQLLALGAQVPKFFPDRLQFFVVPQDFCPRFVDISEIPLEVQVSVPLSTDTPRLAVRRRDKPGHHPIGLPKLLKVLHRSEENRLVDVISVGIAEPISIGHGVHESRILADEALPGLRLATLTGIQQRSCLVRLRHGGDCCRSGTIECLTWQQIALQKY